MHAADGRIVNVRVVERAFEQQVCVIGLTERRREPTGAIIEVGVFQRPGNTFGDISVGEVKVQLLPTALWPGHAGAAKFISLRHVVMANPLEIGIGDHRHGGVANHAAGFTP